MASPRRHARDAALLLVALLPGVALHHCGFVDAGRALAGTSDDGTSEALAVANVIRGTAAGAVPTPVAGSATSAQQGVGSQRLGRGASWQQQEPQLAPSGSGQAQQLVGLSGLSGSSVITTGSAPFDLNGASFPASDAFLKPGQGSGTPNATPSPSQSSTPIRTPTSSMSQPSSMTAGSDPLSLHNQYRAAHRAPALTWDDSLAASAQQWANHLASQCAFYHSGSGENLAAGFMSWADVALAWYSEGKSYDYAKPGYSSATGHFTQMVWVSTSHLGCAQASSNCQEGIVWVCHYDPPGNVNAPQYFRDNVLPPTQRRLAV